MRLQEPTYFAVVESPIGSLTLTSNGEAITGLYVTGHKVLDPRPAHWVREDSPFDEAASELEAYWRGELREFHVPLAPRGTPFQTDVWDALRTVPYGATVTYGELALRIGRPNAARAVGAANGRNPISIFIPCHRVLGANSSLTGYAGGVTTKRWLLDLEARRA